MNQQVCTTKLQAPNSGSRADTQSMPGSPPERTSRSIGMRLSYRRQRNSRAEYLLLCCSWWRISARHHSRQHRPGPSQPGCRRHLFVLSLKCVCFSRIAHRKRWNDTKRVCLAPRATACHRVRALSNSRPLAYASNDTDQPYQTFASSMQIRMQQHLRLMNDYFFFTLPLRHHRLALLYAILTETMERNPKNGAHLANVCEVVCSQCARIGNRADRRTAKLRISMPFKDKLDRQLMHQCALALSRARARALVRARSFTRILAYKPITLGAFL